MCKVAICISSYKRPVGLERLLKSICCLEFPNFPKSQVRIVVVETPDENGKISNGLIEKIRKVSPFDILYAIEPKRGLSIARNRSVELSGDVDYCVFVDDDEEVTSRWLDEMLSVQVKFGADVVYGQVRAKYNDRIPIWVKKGGFFQRKYYATGENVPFPDTANVMVTKSSLNMLDGPFDSLFNYSGGEDLDLFANIRNNGGFVVSASKAIVYEHIMADRATSRVILRRAYNSGIVIVNVERKASIDRLWAFKRATKGVGNLILGTLSLPLSLFFGKAAIFKSLFYICRGYGSIAGFFGISFDEWRRYTYGE